MRNKESKPKRHIKMMEGIKEWDPVEALRNVPVTGLDYGSLFNHAPAIRVAVCRALQLGSNGQRTKARAKGPLGRVINTVDTTLAVNSAEVNPEGANAVVIVGGRGPIPAQHGGVLPEPSMRIFNFHSVGDILADLAWWDLAWWMIAVLLER